MFALLGPESFFVSLALLLTVAYPRLGSSWFQNAEQALGAVAQKRGISVLICGLLALVLRAALLAHLDSLPERQLVFVRYKPDHNTLIEWVYNIANIDNSKVVWARDMGQTENEELLRYYKDRRSWPLEPDEKSPKLSPYPSGQATADPSASGADRGCGATGSGGRNPCLSQ
jgi:hypothetical protein